MTQKMEKQALWWWAGDEVSARKRFRERFGTEATLMATPQPGIVALGPVPEHIKTTGGNHEYRGDDESVE